ncbi:hypothetical protein HAH_4450 [Haloarcula hispanica ATCC 33960]|uniref:Uncharacterized protein n=1 Tax=Haloarcula hispanica (strain ATCC 33960 / DSM 4426 / JCM 8911 / NBRC 102182 / NCIMB 2187 / VKM B-1755) TaxID=634497 RepID=G0HZ70_HALHT|nr:hypothetical protein HAH_4450 [Haloarcula hispanica ATCC 33960]
MIARAIREAADERDLSAPDATDFEAIKGEGFARASKETRCTSAGRTC